MKQNQAMEHEIERLIWQRQILVSVLARNFERCCQNTLREGGQQCSILYQGEGAQNDAFCRNAVLFMNLE